MNNLTLRAQIYGCEISQVHYYDRMKKIGDMIKPLVIAAIVSILMTLTSVLLWIYLPNDKSLKLKIFLPIVAAFSLTIIVIVIMICRYYLIITMIKTELVKFQN